MTKGKEKKSEQATSGKPGPGDSVGTHYVVARNQLVETRESDVCLSILQVSHSGLLSPARASQQDKQVSHRVLTLCTSKGLHRHLCKTKLAQQDLH